jgi:hypothetical protein
MTQTRSYHKWPSKVFLPKSFSSKQGQKCRLTVDLVDQVILLYLSVAFDSLLMLNIIT